MGAGRQIVRIVHGDGQSLLWNSLVVLVDLGSKVHDI